MSIIEDRSKWNKEILNQEGSFLQSWEWGVLQAKLGKNVIRLAEPGICGSILIHDLPLRHSYFYIPRGPIGSGILSPESFGVFINSAQKNTGQRRPIFLRIEPAAEDTPLNREKIKQCGLRITNAVQPQTTLLLDLSKNSESLLDDMEHDTRYSIRVAERRGVRIIRFRNLQEKQAIFEEVWKLLLETNLRHGLTMYPKEYYLQVALLDGDCRSEIILAQYEGKYIAAAIIVFFGKTATYLYAASANGYGKFNAPTLLLWHSILEAKNNHCGIFDFWGINSKNKNWSGITAFKKSFGGQEARYLGTWDFVFDKLRYLGYQVAQRLFK
ncbi:MAG: peptidoglycan bridge formation glycyltransferase FemA/FemB family protein [Parcubacteria group bacterium]|nr:peptidoglycan bridge formation glycyltransferase FemA/FemB family protein [Parcubacteria group bacterium]